jgi:NAD(P)-dependent dehydrogenase (short-subunit alcohol dehydrogenase family)
VQIEQRVAVVTGAASGIGRSLCLAFAERGARAVVACDIDAGGAAAVAAQLESVGHQVMAVTADMADPADVTALVDRAQDAFGQIDLFCSNAGIIVGGGVELDDEAWRRMWAVNVQSHVYAARAVIPGMLARGEGYLVFTASAAGLLTQLGSAPYAVTKHALVALAEWLSITYGDSGIGVSCLCPQAVTTNLLATSVRQFATAPRAGTGSGEPACAGTGASGPQPARGSAATAPSDARSDGNTSSGSAQAAVDGVLTPDQVAASVIDAIEAQRFLILPHPEVATYERRRADDRERWLRGMRRMQARLDGER